jgi:aspartate aminotransferase
MDYETPQFYRVMRYAARADRDVVDMVSGSPDWPPPDAVREGLREYADAGAEEFNYPPSVGLTPLRDEIADRRSVDRSRVLVTNGAGEANHLATTAALGRGAGSEVILADPVYPYYAGRLNLLDARKTSVPAEETGQLDPTAVREAASPETAAILVNSPNNPTGAVYPPETIRELVGVAADHDAVLISDEVYDHFDYTGTFESALATASDHVVVTNAVSKSMAVTGLRVGYGIFPPEEGPLDLGSAARTRHMLTNVTGSRPAQYAVRKALRETPPDYYERNRELVRERIETFTSALDAVGADYTTPGGAFYVMARFDGLSGTMAATERLIDEAGVAGMPGAAFGESRADWFRFALVTPRVEAAADRLRAFLSSGTDG